MARQARLTLAGIPLHVIQRGVNREDIFLDDGDRQRYLSLLAELGERHACAVHAYVLMSNHVHLLLTPMSVAGASVLMKHLGQRYAQYANATYERTGGLFEDRFRSSIVDTERYFLTCQRYIELNPVRAGMVRHPRDYPWSSYRANAEGVPGAFLRPHGLFLALGSDAESRCERYRALFDEVMPLGEIERIRDTLNSGTILGSDAFIDAFEKCFGKKAKKRPRGRARSAAEVCPQ